jgi:hypothetical protein
MLFSFSAGLVLRAGERVAAGLAGYRGAVRVAPFTEA